MNPRDALHAPPTTLATSTASAFYLSSPRSRGCEFTFEVQQLFSKHFRWRGDDRICGGDDSIRNVIRG